MAPNTSKNMAPGSQVLSPLAAAAKERNDMLVESITFDPEFEKQLTELLDRVMPVNQKWLACCKLLKDFKISYKLEKGLPKDFLVHLANRGGLGLNWHNAHKNGAVIFSVGADKSQLQAAFAFELGPSGTKRDQHMQFNLKLVEKSNGLLAPVNFGERYVSVGCGHTVAFAKQADRKGATTEPSLSDADGRIDLNKLSSDQVLISMIYEGWDWTIIPFGVDVKFPKLAQVGQAALNASNNVASLVSELESAVTLCSTMEDPCVQNVDDWEALALENVRSVCAPCASYCHIILRYVKEFAGGPGAPMIKFMDAAAKQFHCNVCIGENFWAAVTDAEFFVKTSKFPLVRTACMLCNLCSDKKEDGIARLLLKGEITKLASKAAADKVVEAEHLLKDAMGIKDTLVQTGSKSEEDTMKPLGKLFVRIALLLTGKEKLGREKVEYTSEQIKSMFLKDLEAAFGHPVSFEPWGIEADAPAAPAASVERTQAFATLAQHDDPAWIASQAKTKFELGMVVYEKTSGSSPATKLFYITSVANDVSLAQVCSYVGVPLIVTVPLASFIEGWSHFKGDVPVRMSSGQDWPRKPYALDITRAALHAAVLQVQQTSLDSIVFYRRPDEIRVTKKIPKGKLVLAPIASLTNFSIKGGQSALELGSQPVGGFDKIPFFVYPAPKPPLQLKSIMEWPEDSSRIAFWWVFGSTTPDKDRANMACFPKTVKVNGKDIAIQVMSNTKELAPGEKLQMFKQKAAVPVALKSATVVSGASGSSGGPKKRARVDN